MEKKSVIVLVIATLIFSSIVNAEINLNPLTKVSYNKGDNLFIAGSLRSHEDLSAPLRIFLTCDTSTLQVYTKNYELPAQQEVSFSHDVTIPFSMSGDFCIIAVTLGQEKAQTEPFVITKSLKGTFTLTPIQVQAGQSFEFFGTITKINGQKVDGSAIIYLEKEGQNYLTTNVRIQSGKIDYKERIYDVPQGSYHINLAVNDIDGNEEFFFNTAILNVYTSLKVTASTDKSSYNPKDTIKLTGDAKKTVGVNIEDAVVTVGFDGNHYDTDIVAGKFRIELPVSASISSGVQQIDVLVKDKDGNSGQKTIKVNIIPKENMLQASLDKDSYFPKEIISITPSLYDQANDLIDKKISVGVFDAKGGQVLQRSLQSGQAYQFKLDQYAIPGTWKLKLKSSSLEHQLDFVIETVEEVDISLDTQTLVITNIGNVNYDRSILVEAINDKAESKTISIRTKIGPSQKLNFDLAKELPQGNYDEIRIKDRDQTFFNVDIRDDRTAAQKIGNFLDQATGSVVGASGTTSNNRPLIYSLVAIIILLSIIVIIRMRARKKMDRFRQREIKAGQQARKYLQETAVPQKRVYGKATESDIKDFKKHMLLDIKDQQKEQVRQEDWGSSAPTVRRSIERKILFDKDSRQNTRMASYSFDRPKERRSSFTSKPTEQEEESSGNSTWRMFD